MSGLGHAIEEADLAMYQSKRDRSAANNIRAGFDALTLVGPTSFVSFSTLRRQSDRRCSQTGRADAFRQLVPPKFMFDDLNRVTGYHVDAFSQNSHIACCGTHAQQLESVLPSSRF
jgi:hypothetical protein